MFGKILSTKKQMPLEKVRKKLERHVNSRYIVSANKMTGFLRKFGDNIGLERLMGGNIEDLDERIAGLYDFKYRDGNDQPAKIKVPVPNYSVNYVGYIKALDDFGIRSLFLR